MSVPEHCTTTNVWSAIIPEGTVQIAMYGNGARMGITGLNPTALMREDHSA
ncbi:hypothetical protein [Paractinoplanes lichenicola]|uniref:hypothetical protein n=1 Tax=Paractinoplanes lichenicola TaxID=2802976 RepID=UPI0027DE0867|nr:hypothetical protein [Actinoplanes lichenicola]